MNSRKLPWALMKPRAITLDGDRIVYRIAGKGPVLLLVHGMAGSSVTWRRIMPALAKRFTVLAPDLHVARSRGGSVHARQPGDLAQLHIAGGRGCPPGVLSQSPRCDRLERAGRERASSAVPGGAVADPDRMGCARPVHSGSPRGR